MSLLITTAPVTERFKKDEAVLNISPDEDPNRIARKLVSLYLVGYNTIRILSDRDRISPAQRETVKSFTRTKLAGTEVIMDLPNEIVVKIVLGYPELPVKDAIRRMALIAKSMLEDALSLMNNRDQNLAESIVDRDDDVDRFGMYVIRQLKSAVKDRAVLGDIGLRSARDCLGYRLIVKSVERIADHAALISKNAMEIERRVDPQLQTKFVEMKDIALKYFENAMESLFKEDTELAEAVIEGKGSMVVVEKAIADQIHGRKLLGDAVMLRFIAESLRRVYEYSCDIAEVVLNLAAEKILSSR
ncbi:MAG: PhoU domain-containing protein, partial [Candidatus Hadarchaeales archaeon]